MTHDIPSETPEEEAAREARNAMLPPGALPEPSPSDLIDGVRQVAQDLITSGLTDARGRLTDKGYLHSFEPKALEKGFIDSQGSVTQEGKQYLDENIGNRVSES